MTTLRVKLHIEDRLGLVHDVSGIITAGGANILSLEFSPEEIYLEVDALAESWPELEKGLLGARGVRGIQRISAMPSAEREQQLQAVLNSISDGVLAIDAAGRISHCNPVAVKILGWSNLNVIGRLLQEMLPVELPMLKCLRDGKPYDHQEIILNTSRGRCHYVTSGRPLFSPGREKVIGVVATIKDMGEVRRLLYQVTAPAMVTFHELVGESRVWRETIALAEKASASHATILLRGESGTGKELLARSIHMASPRREGPFVPINCAAVPESLLESELFGYEAGAFTGAKPGGRQGLFELADGGTLYLDEIGELSPHLQAKLLRVLQEGKVRRVGGKQEAPVNIRIVASTHRNLEAMTAEGSFRADLYYRLNVVPIFLPPLRERKQDIPVLALHFCNKIASRQGIPVPVIENKALEQLQAHHWPGNVRELENVIERAVALVSGDIIRQQDLMLTPSSPPASGEGSFREIMSQTEYRLLQQLLPNYGSARQAAAALGLSHTALLKKIHRHRLPLPGEWK